MKLSEQILSLTQDPNIIGEILRDKFFYQDKNSGKLGCYNTFELRPEVKEFPSSEDDGITYHSAQLDDVYMVWSWDGDGCLDFTLGKNGKTLLNNDCKKSGNWIWI